MSAAEDFDLYFAECPLVALIRGVTPQDAEATAAAIFEGGIRIIEVPLNSPRPFDSIEIIAKSFGGRALVGAGTVLNTDDVQRVKSVGGRLIVAPNMNEEVIRATADAGMVSSPGVFTPTEAFAAIAAGAHALKLFPAEAASPAVVKAQKAVLPKGFPLILAICSPATLFCLLLGQSGLFVAALWLLAFRGRWWAVAAISIKPHVGLLSILGLKGWPDLARAAILTLLLILTSALVFGPDVWTDFAKALHEQWARIGVREQWYVMGVSPAIGYGLWGWLMFALLAGFLLLKNVTPFTSATAAMLISPYGFHYDMAVACFGFAITIYCHWADMRPFYRAILVGAFLTPVIVNGGTWFAPPILLAALWIQVGLGRQNERLGLVGS
jgi:2-dehydro-3-deoxyphosphogalactonate aldolase